MKKEINLNKHISEGWTVGCFIKNLEPSIKYIADGQSWQKPFIEKHDLKKWCMENQPYYKKHIPEVVEYFWDTYFKK